MASPPIVLLTDFGQADGYPGVMKGVIYSFCPDAPIIDLSHDIPAHNLRSVAFLLSKNYRYFPHSSIFVVVVDPGVGSNRKILFLHWRDWYFLAPDNGVLTPLLNDKAGIKTIREVTQTDIFLVRRGNTFDGRDRFAPVAAHLARGFRQEQLGPHLSNPVLLHDILPETRRKGNRLFGQVAYVDNFGNLITTIEEDELLKIRKDDEPAWIHVQGQRIPIMNNYADIDPGKPIAVVGGFGTLEIAVNQGSAFRMLRVPVGQLVEVMVEKEHD